MRRAALVVFVLGVALVASAGCSGLPDRKSTGSAGSSAAKATGSKGTGAKANGAGANGAGASETAKARPAPLPVVEAGGACELLTYEMIKDKIGVQFEVAAAAQKTGTLTCVVQRRGTEYPDLTLSVTGTTADQKFLGTALVPKGATAVTGLGTAAYSLTTAPVGAIGPGCEVGWLSSNQRLLVLRYRLATTGTTDEIAAAIPKMIELAKAVDTNPGQAPH